MIPGKLYKIKICHNIPRRNGSLIFFFDKEEFHLNDEIVLFLKVIQEFYENRYLFLWKNIVVKTWLDHMGTLPMNLIEEAYFEEVKL